MLSPIPMPFDERVSFSSRPIASELPPAFSAPVGHRAILAEVRASQPLRPLKLNFLRHPHDPVATRPSSKAPVKAIAIPDKDKAGTMSRGYVAGRSAHITTFAWLSSVKVGNKRDDSSGPASGGESGTASRFNSRSRPPSIIDPSMSMSVLDARSGSRDRDDGSRETDSNQSLQDECILFCTVLVISCLPSYQDYFCSQRAHCRESQTRESKSLADGGQAFLPICSRRTSQRREYVHSDFMDRGVATEHLSSFVYLSPSLATIPKLLTPEGRLWWISKGIH